MGGVVNKITDTLGLTDSEAGLDELASARGISKDIARLYKDIDLPDIEAMKLALEAPELVGLLEAEELGSSAMDEISLDPRLREARLQELAKLQEEGEQGYTAEDRAAQNMLRRDADARAQAEQAAILSGMAQRGALDSGAQLSAQLGASQASAQRRAEGADRQAMDAANRRRMAANQAANLAGNIESQDFSRQAQQASARDIINRFNTQNRQNVAAQNLAARQAQENQRAALSNQQQQYNKQLQQQNFQNQLQKAGGQSGAMSQQANMLAQQGAGMQQGAAQGLGNLANLATAGANLYTAFSDKNMKENVQPASSDLEEMLDKLTASKYNYKEDTGLGSEGHIGVMAQDLEKSSAGSQFVEEDDMGRKMVDYGKMAPTTLAALAEIHERVKNLEKKD